MWITRELNAAKDKIIFSNDEKINLFHERKTLKMTQKEFAKFKNTSRNTIQRAEKYFKQQINKNGQIN